MIEGSYQRKKDWMRRVLFYHIPYEYPGEWLRVLFHEQKRGRNLFEQYEALPKVDRGQKPLIE
jgi:hypothetical protein